MNFTGQSLKHRIFLTAAMFMPSIVMLIWDIIYVTKAFNLSKDLPPVTLAMHFMMCMGLQVMMFLLLVDGNPLRWWKFFIGYAVNVNSSRVAADQTVTEIRDWLKDTVRTGYYEENATRYVFMTKKSAALFKLTWG